jgi:hypothetical protein
MAQQPVSFFFVWGKERRGEVAVLLHVLPENLDGNAGTAGVCNGKRNREMNMVIS